MVNFKIGNGMWKVSWLTWYERGTKQKSESPTGIEPLTSQKHRAGSLSIELRELLGRTHNDFDSVDSFRACIITEIEDEWSIAS